RASRQQLRHDGTLRAPDVDVGGSMFPRRQPDADHERSLSENFRHVIITQAIGLGQPKSALGMITMGMGLTDSSFGLNVFARPTAPAPGSPRPPCSPGRRARRSPD